MLMSVIIRLSERNVPHEVLEIWFDWFISTAASRLRPTIKYDKGNLRTQWFGCDDQRQIGRASCRERVSSPV